jgi:predicted Rossmann fold nucleotide-binding protein DprA/Smf involved in DNA uptake
MGGALAAVLAKVPLTTKGDVNLLNLRRLIALFCSVRCPEDLILKTYDLARKLREAKLPVIGGFHSPMEKECLRLLLRGQQPVLVCLARSTNSMRIPSDWRQPLLDGRLLVLSPFSTSQHRPTAKLAAQRNELMADLAHKVFIAHAAAVSKTEAFARSIVGRGKPLFTLDGPANANLVEIGAQAICPDDIQKLQA